METIEAFEAGARVKDNQDFTEDQRLTQFWQRHRGPFRLMVHRPFVTKKGFSRSEALTGEIEGPDVQDEAQALLDDPRDTIESIDVWSIKEEQFVHGFKRRV